MYGKFAGDIKPLIVLVILIAVYFKHESQKRDSKESIFLVPQLEKVEE